MTCDTTNTPDTSSNDPTSANADNTTTPHDPSRSLPRVSDGHLQSTPPYAEDKSLQNPFARLGGIQGIQIKIMEQKIHMGTLLYQRFLQTTDMVILEKMIEIFTEACNIIPEGHPSHIIALSNLGGALTCRFYHKGDMDDLNSSIHYQKKAITLSSTDDPTRVSSLVNLAEALQKRYESTGDQEDIERSIGFRCEVLDHRPVGHPGHQDAVSNLANALRLRAKATGSIEDFRESNGLMRSLADLNVQEGPRRHLDAIQTALTSFSEAYSATKDLVLLEDAISFVHEVLDLEYLSNQERMSSLRTISTMYMSRYRHNKDLNDCTIAIEYLNDALELPTGPGQLYMSILFISAKARQTRYTDSEDPDEEDIEKAISLMEIAVGLDTGVETEDHINSHILLASLYHTRNSPTDSALAIMHYEQAAELEPDFAKSALTLLNVARVHMSKKPAEELSVAKAIETYDLVLQMLPSTHSQYPMVTRQRAIANLLLSAHTDDLVHLDTATQSLMESLPSRNRTEYLQDLQVICGALYSRYVYSGDEEDMDKVIHLLTELLPAATHELPLSGASSILGLILLNDNRNVDAHNPSPSIALLEKLLKSIPTEHRARRLALAYLGQLYHAKWVLQGESHYLYDAIGLLEQARILVKDESSILGNVLNNLGHCLHGRFNLTASLEDADNAIKMFQEALPLIVSDASDRARALRGFSSVLRNRYDVLGHFEDLMYAQEMLQEVLDIIPEDDPTRAISFSNLGYIHLDLYRHSSRISNLDKGMGYFNQALQLRPPGHPERRHTLARMAEGLELRAKVPGHERDMEEATVLFREILELTPKDDRELSTTLHILGHHLLKRYKKSKKVEELDEAIECHRQGMIVANPTDWRGAHFSHGLCEAYIVRYTVRGDGSDLDRALTVLVDTVPDRQTEAEVNLSSAMRTMKKVEDRLEGGLVTKLTAEQRMLLLNGYTKMISLLPRVAYFGRDTASRLQSLKASEGLACDASALALSLALPEVALELLENGRAVFWAQALRLRLSTDGLPVELGENLRSVSQELEVRGNTFQSSLYMRHNEGQEPVRFIDEEAARLRRLNDKFEALLQDVRSLDGFEQFLKGARFATLSNAARYGPVVVLNASRTRCDVVIIRAPSTAPQHLTLPHITITELRIMAQKMNTLVVHGREGESLNDTAVRAGRIRQLTGESLLRKLWDLIVKPVIDALQLEKSNGLSRPRLWWCPSGIFASLPIHAAGDYGAGGSCCSDYVVSSYTPTLQALCSAQQKMHPITISDAKTLSVAEPAAPNLPTLPNTLKEVDVVSSILQGKLCSIQRGATTTASVMKTLEGCTVLHLACHGIQDSNNPLHSGFCLSDGRLSVSKLMQMNLPRAFFAFLSACESARGDASQPDQAIHLSATMLYCGFKSVIGTMWSMNDADGPAVARLVFSKLFKDAYLDPGMIPYALDDAVRELRSRGLPASRWATYVHIGA